MVESTRAKLIREIKTERQKHLKPFETELGIAGAKDYLEYLRFMLGLQKKPGKKLIQEEIDRHIAIIAELEKSARHVGKYLGDLGNRLGMEGYMRPLDMPQVISNIEKYSKMLMEFAKNYKTVRDV